MATLAQGSAALHWVEDMRYAALPPPERENPSLLRGIREVAGLAGRIDIVLDRAALETPDALDMEYVLALDATLSMKFDEGDVDFLRALAEDSGAGTPYRNGPPPPDHAEALRALAALVARYIAGEFMPPTSWFGLRDAEA